MERKFELVIVGGGSGGFAAALAAARLGVSVLLIEKSDSLGGNATRGGVNNWEPGVGGTGIPFDLYRRLRRRPKAIGIYKYNRHMKWPRPTDDGPVVPGSELIIDPTRRYIDSLRRHGAGAFAESEAFIRSTWAGVPFEPEACSQEMLQMLKETGNCTVLLNIGVRDVTTSGSLLEAVCLDDGSAVSADLFIDATDSLLLVKSSGCETALGQEPRSLYLEPSAPLAPSDVLNGTTLLYRVARKGPNDLSVDPLPAGMRAHCWWDDKFPPAVFTQYPNGDFNVNALPVMAGREAFQLGFDQARAECERRIIAHWHHVQTVFPEYRNFQICWVAPGLGIREGARLIARKMLTEHDLLEGISRQTDPDIVTIADHPRDTHGADTGRAGCAEFSEPYGVPFRCLLPKKIDNLAVASRGAGFSSVAASSCRLTRTIMQLGQACGTAAALAVAEQSRNFSVVDPKSLRHALAEQHVELEWPRSEAMLAYLEDEDRP